MIIIMWSILSVHHTLFLYLLLNKKMVKQSETWTRLVYSYVNSRYPSRKIMSRIPEVDLLYEKLLVISYSEIVLNEEETLFYSKHVIVDAIKKKLRRRIRHRSEDEKMKRKKREGDSRNYNSVVKKTIHNTTSK